VLQANCNVSLPTFPYTQHPYKSLHFTAYKAHISNPLLFNWSYCRKKTCGGG